MLRHLAAKRSGLRPWAFAALVRLSLFALPALLALFAACGGTTTGSQGNDGGTPDAISPDGSFDSHTVGTPETGSPPPSDAGMCIDIDLSTYDISCTGDSDCISVTAGEICTGGCACGGATINASGSARYQAALNQVQTLGCPCHALGLPACVNKQCTICGGPNPTPGCPDGG